MTAPDFTDPAHERVGALSNAGHDWLTACRMVFAPHLLPGRVPISERLRARLRAVAGMGSETGGAALNLLTAVALVAYFGCLAVCLGWLR